VSASPATPWKFLDEYRGTMFPGEWPTVPQLFAITVRRFPDRPCLTAYDPERTSLTYAETAAKADAVARALRARGAGRGAKVAVTGHNSPQWAVAWLGVLAAGAVVVPIDNQLGDAEVANLVRAGDVSVLFCDAERIGSLTRACPRLSAVYSLTAGHPGYVYDLDGPPTAAADPALETDLAAIMFTSGTTGRPKGVMLTHRNLSADCYLAQGNLSVYPTDVFYALLPIHHSYTMLAVFIEALSTGAEVVFGKKMVTKQILADLKQARVTMFLGVPMLFNKVLAGIMKGIREKGPIVNGLLRTLMAVSGLVKKVTGRNPGKRIFHSVLERASLASIRICISGGGPLSPEVFRRFNQLGIDFVQGYGLTETSPIVTLNPTEDYRETSVGKVIPGAEMRILEPDAEGIGEIAIRGPMVMAGYYQMPEETAAVLSSDGWLKTGDLGFLDRDNYLYLTGRAKNLIVTGGGKNVYPEEIENRFQLFDEVEQVLVLGYLEDAATRSEAIEALLYPNLERFRGADGQATPDWAAITTRLEAIVADVNQKLLPYQRISRVTVLRERMEETTTKKVKRFAVKR